MYYFCILFKKIKYEILIGIKNKNKNKNKNNHSNKIIKQLKNGGIIVERDYIPYSDYPLE